MMKLLVCDAEGTIFKTSFQTPNVKLSSTICQIMSKRLDEEALEAEIETH